MDDFTKAQETYIDNSILSILAEFRTGQIDFRQALKEIKQAFDYARKNIHE